MSYARVLTIACVYDNHGWPCQYDVNIMYARVLLDVCVRQCAWYSGGQLVCMLSYTHILYPMCAQQTRAHKVVHIKQANCHSHMVIARVHTQSACSVVCARKYKWACIRHYFSSFHARWEINFLKQHTRISSMYFWYLKVSYRRRYYFVS